MTGLIQDKLMIPDSQEVDIEEFNAFRKDFVNIHQIIFSVKGLKNTVIIKILEKFQLIQGGNSNQNMIENIFFLLTNLNFINNDPIDIELANKILATLFSNDWLSIIDERTTLLFFDLLNKLIAFYLANPESITKVVNIYLSKSGIFTNNFLVGKEVAVLFWKFLEKTKSSIQHIVKDILGNLKYLLDALVNLGHFTLLKEYSSLYSSFGLVVSQKYLGEDLRNGYVQV